MKIQTALKSRTVWCGIVAMVIAVAKLLWPESEALDEALKNKETMASQLVLLAQGLLGFFAIVFRVKAKARD